MTSSIPVGYNLRAIMMLSNYKSSAAITFTSWYWCVSTRVAGVAFNEERELK